MGFAQKDYWTAMFILKTSLFRKSWKGFTG